MMKRGFFIIGVMLITSLSTQAQGFSSGSTGADGPLDLTSGNLTLQIPESGVFNFTTVNIPSGRTLSFTPNLRNTPVIMLAQGTVTVSGTISINGQTGSLGSASGPGGFNGGTNQQNGLGPGGGNSNGINGKWIGPLSLVPIIGGSGGKGSTFSADGGGGGGGIVIASSTFLMISQGGGIFANGGNGACNGGGGGAGGAIRLVANSITVAGQLSAQGGGAGCTSVASHPGIIRVEAPPGALTFTGTSNPPAVLTTINPVIVPDANTPSMTIASIGGFPVPSYSGSVPGRVALLLPSQLADPINLVVQASNIPVGTQVMMNISGSSGTTYTPGTLTGTLASSTATLSISGLDRNAASFMFVFATFDPPSSASNVNPSGPNHVAKIRIESAMATKPKFIFLRADGSEIDLANVPQSLLLQFGQ